MWALGLGQSMHTAALLPVNEKMRMNDPRKLKIVLFALTGFGNSVLDALLNDERVMVQAVFTVKYDQPFPYYSERQLIEECAERGIPCHPDVKVSGDEGMDLLRKYSPDLIMMATFKQIIRENVLNLPRLGVINFHPSLLPKYRGPCPTNAALLNDDRIAGVTVHYVTKQVDEGNILLQRWIPIDDVENDGQLRKRLALLSAEMATEVVGMFAHFKSPTGTPQDSARATSAPKPIIEDGHLERAADINMIRNFMRAFNPLPGTSYLLEGQRIAVDKFELICADRADGVYDREDAIDVIIDAQAIRLFKKI